MTSRATREERESLAGTAEEGRAAYAAGLRRESEGNNYHIGSAQYYAFQRGFREAEHEADARIEAELAEEAAQEEFERRLKLAIERGALREFVLPSALCGKAT